MSATDYLNRIVRDASIRLPGVLDDVLKRELFAVFDDFFRWSWLWTETVTGTILADRYTAELEAQDYNAITLGVASVLDADGVPVRATMPEIGTLRVETPFTANTRLTVKLVLTVAEPVNATTGYPVVPDWIVGRYWQAFLDGLLSRVLLHPAKPYTNAGLAEFHGRKFLSAKNQARVAGHHENLQGGQNWTYPQNFATGRR